MLMQAQIVAASGIQSSVFRVGQLSGADDTGAWSVTEWIPSIIKSSLKLGTLPDAGGVSPDISCLVHSCSSVLAGDLMASNE